MLAAGGLGAIAAGTSGPRSPRRPPRRRNARCSWPSCRRSSCASPARLRPEVGLCCSTSRRTTSTGTATSTPTRPPRPVSGRRRTQDDWAVANLDDPVTVAWRDRLAPAAARRLLGEGRIEGSASASSTAGSSHATPRARRAGAADLRPPAAGAAPRRQRGRGGLRRAARGRPRRRRGRGGSSLPARPPPARARRRGRRGALGERLQGHQRARGRRRARLRRDRSCGWPVGSPRASSSRSSVRARGGPFDRGPVRDRRRRARRGVRRGRGAGPDVDTIEEAVEVAAQVATAGDTVLLAPACASFDQFRDYADRGERFAAAVLEVVGATVTGTTGGSDGLRAPMHRRRAAAGLARPSARPAAPGPLVLGRERADVVTACCCC
jgi:hypothetical protein